ncbi:hypothetical protein [Methylobacterium nodulans]|uniref:Uncharacterized protein n=1 Tax=Methylobacterium nodulans (strain LMG 21967 / CNCM I-2342 / ORS 2060) TaxID=460265 RepID=B8IV76_METNO|nr:hypothetical protein [Methylobacterium nodulans]ACL60927.1 conserved hypothetical protein [Methylobacterium nodulans ORS 2060]
MDTLAMPLASAAFFTLGCAVLQTFRQYADHITPVLMWAAMLLIVAILTVASVQYQLARGGAGDMLLLEAWMATIP